MRLLSIFGLAAFLLAFGYDVAQAVTAGEYIRNGWEIKAATSSSNFATQVLFLQKGSRIVICYVNGD